MENNNPVCDSLFLKRGWTPVIDEPITETVEVVSEITTDGVFIDDGNSNPTVNQIPLETPKIYKSGDFTTWSKDKIIELATTLGYTITATKKVDIIEEFLTQQK